MHVSKEQLDYQDLERWLDAALRARLEAEPRVGLEDRVLARIATEPQRRPLVQWQAFAAVAAGLAIFVALALTHLANQKRESTIASRSIPAPPRQITPPAIQANRMPQKQVQVARRHGAPDALVRRAVNREEAFPKLATFPSARPETVQERFLARLAARRGSYDVASNSGEEMVALKDLSLPELNIEPLEGTPPDNPPQH